MMRAQLALAAASIAAAVLLAPPATAQTRCGSYATQLEMNACAGRAHDAADAELNAIWAPVIAAQQGNAAGPVLRNAQRAWITFRDLACQAEALQYQGGSILPMIYASCMERETRARIEGLQQFLE